MTPRKSFSKLGNRAVARLNTGLEASLMLLGRTTRCQIENISRKGSRLRLEQPPSIAVTALLRVDKVEALGTVTWVKGSRCGIHFAQPLSVQALDSIRAMAERSDEDQITKFKVAS